ncbi:MAG: hypothetical protein WAV21_00205 [Minisyncoccia bacterium]
MKTVKSTSIESLHRGIAIIFTTDDGEVVALQFGKHQARQLMKAILLKLGVGRGEGEE